MVRSKEDKSKYDQEYQKSHMKRVSVWFNLEKDKELINWFESREESVSAYIKSLIRQDIENHKQ